MFEGVDDISEAVHRVNTEADVVWVDGHSDDGHAFEVFHQRYAKEISAKTTVLILGDALNNYHPYQSWVLTAIAKRARHLSWPHPPPKSSCDTGDSTVVQSAAPCHLPLQTYQRASVRA